MVMTVILVLATFLGFIFLDYLMNRRKAVITVPVHAPAPITAPARLGGEIVEGFLVPGQLSYQHGHAWLTRERTSVRRVGADEFAAALLGKVEKIELSKPGEGIRQGQKVLAFDRTP